jgi:osmotically-inducible protein OsmY
VNTSKHVVTLKGTVTGRAGRARATTVAKGTEGVRRVVNQLTIGPKRKG